MVTRQIDKITYNKAVRQPYDPKRANGYQPRPAGRLAPRSIIVHTTNGRHGSSFSREANYIANSRSVSDHFMISKRGEIIQHLDPRLYIAYHAGCVKSTAFSNPYAIGIEIHNTPTEGHITDDQYYALDWLVRDLIHIFTIDPRYVEMHRAVAVYCKGHRLAGKLGRKIDPSGFPDTEFYAWKDSLYTAPIVLTEYRVISVNGVYVRQSPQVNDHNIAGTLEYNDTFIADVIKKDERGQYIKGTNLWAHILKGTSKGVPVDHLGFVHLSNLRQI